MSTLASIPLEIREQIFQDVILSPLKVDIPPEMDAADDLLERERLGEDITYRSWTKGGWILLPRETAVPAILPLLLLCKQMHEEVQGILSRIKNKLDFDVDVIVADQAEVAPTWTRLPALVKRVRSVNTTFRIAGDFQSYHPPNRRARGWGYRGFRGGDGAGPAFAWVVYNLLERFLRLGPVGRYTGKNPRIDRKLIIEKLDINIITPKHIDPKRFRRPRSYDHASDVTTEILCPEYLTDFIRRELLSLLCVGYHTQYYGDILYEQIGRIRVLADGEVKTDWKLGEILVRCNPPGSVINTSREAPWRAWYPKALERREKNGLPMGSKNEPADFKDLLWGRLEGAEPMTRF